MMPISSSSISFVTVYLAVTTNAHVIPRTTPETPQPTWSTEAILGLIAIFVALLCCGAGLAVPWFRHSRKLSSCKRRD